MKVRYLGTGAAEGIPAVFCQCETCQKASEQKGKDIRTRASALINDKLLLDISPDLYFHKLRYDLDLWKVKAACITHSHSDHFDGAELTRRSSANYCHILDEKPLQVYGNSKVCRLGAESLKEEFGREDDPSVLFLPAEPFTEIRIEELTVTPIPANHDPAEMCFIYLVEEGENRILYANDTGLLGEEAYAFLKGKALSLVSLDCTFGAGGYRSSVHMGIEENLLVVKRLEEEGCLTSSTVIAATHFSHNCGMNHQELEKKLGEAGIRAAWDGLMLQWQ
ncbi:MAG: MBL fold metallo-hydrolase [Lacrimispora sp.]|uniref:MBL fold metallo-hydrolase n=1 Tax=Lacrimispora sp. TaxID=2719234 RepID=UPI0039E462B3